MITSHKRIKRRQAILIMALVLGLVLAACGEESGSPTTVTSNDPSSSDSAGTTQQDTNDPPTLGWIVTGPDGTEFEFTEVLTANGADTTNNYSYTLDGQPRQGLYTQFVVAAQIDVAVTAGGPATVQLVRGTLGADGFSVDVAEIIETQDVTSGSQVSLSSGD